MRAKSRSAPGYSVTCWLTTYDDGGPHRLLMRSVFLRSLRILAVVLIEAINVKRKSLFEYESAPYVCLDWISARRRLGVGRRLCI